MERFGPTRRGGPVFRWLGEPLAIDLANTVMVVSKGEVVDLLAAPDDLRRWLEAERERLGDGDPALAHLDQVRSLRDAVRALLAAAARGTAPPPRALEHVNATSRAAPIAPQLEVGSGRGLTTVELPHEGDALAAVLGIVARSTITLLTGPELERLRACEAPSCGMFFLGARRWCCAACGNRARAARHYGRMRARAVASARQR